MKILIADDHAIVRAGLMRIVQEAYKDSLLEEAESCHELKIKFRKSAWDLLILDISLSDGNSFEVVDELKEINPAVKIIVLSMHDEKQFVIKALQLGINGFVTKDRAPEELIKSIENVMSGKQYLCESVVHQIANSVAGNNNLIPPHERLSSREFEVFLHISQAISVSEIARSLGLSVKTISTYRTRILDKMELRNNAELMKYAVDNKLGK